MIGFDRMDSEEVKGGGGLEMSLRSEHRLDSGIRVNVRARRHFAWIEPCKPSALGGTREALIVSLREGVPLPPECCKAFCPPAAQDPFASKSRAQDIQSLAICRIPPSGKAS